MALFLDANALVKVYVREARGTETMKEIMARPEFQGGLFISDHVAIEVYACLAKKLREKEILPAQFRTACAEFDRDYNETLGVVTVMPALVEEGINLIRRHPMRGVSAKDMLHVATAEHVAGVLVTAGDPVTFVSADKKLRTVAKLRQLGAFDPERQKIGALLPAQLDIPIGAPPPAPAGGA